MRVLFQDALEDVDGLLDDFIELLVAAEPAGFYDDESRTDLRLATREGLVSVLSVLAGVSDIDDGPLDAPRAAGRRQVQQGLPLEGVLRAYRLAGQVLWEYMVRKTRDGASVTDTLLDDATELWRLLDQFSAVASASYREEERQLADRDDRVRLAVLAALFEGRGADPQFARDAAHALGLPVAAPLVCVVGVADAPDQVVFDNARERLRVAGVASVWATFAGSDVGVIVIGPRGVRHVRELLDPCVRTSAGMSSVFTDVSELPRARRLAELAARGTAARGIHAAEDDLVAGLVAEGPLFGELLHERTIGCLLAGAPQDGPSLLATLRAFLEADGSLNLASTRTFVHRNTMMYRLNKIEKITGLGVRTLSDQVVWTLALRRADGTRSA